MYLGVPSIPMPHEVALRLLHPERDSGRRDELAAVPEHSREAGAGVHGLLRADHVSRRGLHAGLRGHVAASRRARWSSRSCTSCASWPSTECHREELRRAKDHLKGSYVLGLESTSSRMGNLARQELYFKRFFSLDEMLERIEERHGGRSAGAGAAVLRSQADGRGDARTPGRLPRAPRRIWSVRSVKCLPSSRSVALHGRLAALHRLRIGAVRARYLQAQTHRLRERFRARAGSPQRSSAWKPTARIWSASPARRWRSCWSIRSMASRSRTSRTACIAQWGIGKKGKDEGVLICFAVKDHKDRAEVGYGLEPIITDGYAGGVLRGIRPILRQGNYGGALLAAAQQFGATIAQSKGVDSAGRPRVRTRTGRRRAAPSIPLSADRHRASSFCSGCSAHQRRRRRRSGHRFPDRDVSR